MNVAKTDVMQSVVAREFEWLNAGLTDAHRFVWPVLQKLLADKRYENVLDLGCGNGTLTQHLTNYCGKCTGVDMSTSGIDIAKRTYPDVEFCVANIEQPLPVKLCNQFDAVVSIEVIEHLLLPRTLFSRAKEALKPNGDFIVSTPYHGYLKNLAIALTGKFDSHWHPLRDYGHVKFFSLKTLENIFQEQGLELQGVWRVGRVKALARSMIMHGKLLM